MLRETNDAVLMLGQYLGAFTVGALTAPFGWTLPGAYDLAFIACLGAASVASLYCVLRALKLASASVVVPYQYVLIFWSVLFGWWGFGDLPDSYTIAGAAIIVAAGLYIYGRERVAARGARDAP